MSVTPPSSEPEAPGSSAHTAVAVGIGAAVGTAALVVGAPVLLPLIGAGALGAAIAGWTMTPILGAGVGSWLGWKVGGKT